MTYSSFRDPKPHWTRHMYCADCKNIIEHDIEVQSVQPEGIVVFMVRCYHCYNQHMQKRKSEKFLWTIKTLSQKEWNVMITENPAKPVKISKT